MQRRGFLQTCAVIATEYAARSRVIADEPAQTPAFCINTKLTEIAEALRECCQVAHVEERLVDNPTIGLTEWEWAHWRTDLAECFLPIVDIVNRELLIPMERVSSIANSGFDEIVQEGCIEGREKEYLRYLRNTHQELIRTQFSVSLPFGVVQDWVPDDAKVQKELTIRANQFRPVHQVIKINDGFRQFYLPPVARLGAAYTHGVLHPPFTLLAAEDEYIDSMAEAAEQSGDPELFRLWVMEARDRHFIKVVREHRRKIMHILLGHGHDLTDDIAISNCETDERISHIIVTVNGVAEAKRIP